MGKIEGGRRVARGRKGGEGVRRKRKGGEGVRQRRGEWGSGREEGGGSWLWVKWREVCRRRRRRRRRRRW